MDVEQLYAILEKVNDNVDVVISYYDTEKKKDIELTIIQVDWNMTDEVLVLKGIQ